MRIFLQRDGIVRATAANNEKECFEEVREDEWKLVF